MKIFVIGTIDKKGGAAMVSWELRKMLKENGHEVNTFVRYKYSNETDVHTIPRKRWQDWLVKLFAYDLGFSWTSYLMKTKEFKEADIVHCHNLHSNFFDLKDLIKISKVKPVIWTQHDIWSITGFSSDMLTLKNPNKKRFLLYLWDNTSFMYWMKKRIYKKSKLYIVTVSKWLNSIFKNSILKDKDISMIYNGVDTSVFKPYNKIKCRKELGLPLHKKIVMAGMYNHNITNGVIDNYIGKEDVFFTAVGSPNIKTLNKNYKVLPYADERIQFAKYLASADVFMHPTWGETFGLACAEALACGVPVVSNDLEAVPEVVLHGKNGYLAPYKDTPGFIKYVDKILKMQPQEYEKMSKEARLHAINSFTMQKMYNSYIDLYCKAMKEYEYSKN